MHYRNTRATLMKMRRAYDRMLGPAMAAQQVTRRHAASLIGLLVFLAHTVNLSLAFLLRVLRFGGALATQAETSGWDVPVSFLAEGVLQELTWVVALLWTNAWALVPEEITPTLDERSYDTIVWVDASASGWGAYVCRPAVARTWRVMAGWQVEMSHSAHAEPLAVVAALEWSVRSGRWARWQ